MSLLEAFGPLLKEPRRHPLTAIEQVLYVQFVDVKETHLVPVQIILTSVEKHPSTFKVLIDYPLKRFNRGQRKILEPYYHQEVDDHWHWEDLSECMRDNLPNWLTLHIPQVEAYFLFNYWNIQKELCIEVRGPPSFYKVNPCEFLSVAYAKRVYNRKEV